MKKKMTLLLDIRRNPFSYAMLVPAAAFTVLFGYLTYPYIIIAFQKYNYSKGVLGSPFVGLENFMFFLRSNNAANVIFNTVWLNLLSIFFSTILAVSLAVMLNEVRGRAFIKITQTTMLFPNYISWVVVSYLLTTFLSTKSGIINIWLSSIGMEKINFYSMPHYWRTILVIVRVWKGVGMSAVIYLAAIAGIDTSVYEAAVIDGATRFKRIWHITVPLLMPTVCIMTLLSLGKIMYGDFGMIYAIVGDNGLLFKTTDVIDTYIFRILRKTGDPSQSMAIGLLQSLMGFVMVFLSNYAVKRFFPDGALF